MSVCLPSNSLFRHLILPGIVIFFFLNTGCGKTSPYSGLSLFHPMFTFELWSHCLADTHPCCYDVCWLETDETRSEGKRYDVYRMRTASTDYVRGVLTGLSIGWRRMLHKYQKIRNGVEYPLCMLEYGSSHVARPVTVPCARMRMSKYLWGIDARSYPYEGVVTSIMSSQHLMYSSVSITEQLSSKSLQVSWDSLITFIVWCSSQVPQLLLLAWVPHCSASNKLLLIVNKVNVCCVLFKCCSFNSFTSLVRWPQVSGIRFQFLLFSVLWSPGQINPFPWRVQTWTPFVCLIVQGSNSVEKWEIVALLIHSVYQVW